MCIRDRYNHFSLAPRYIKNQQCSNIKHPLHMYMSHISVLIFIELSRTQGILYDWETNTWDNYTFSLQNILLAFRSNLPYNHNNRRNEANIVFVFAGFQLDNSTNARENILFHCTDFFTDPGLIKFLLLDTGSRCNITIKPHVATLYNWIMIFNVE